MADPGVKGIEVGGSVTKLPWGCYLLRRALSTEAQRALTDRIGALAGYAFERWPQVGTGQDHPIIIASNSLNARRPRECRRACGLTKCMGHCGRHVGALYERPEDVYAMARDVAKRIAVDAPEVTADAHFDPTHFWSLVYGDTSSDEQPADGDDPASEAEGGDNRFKPRKGRNTNCGKMQSHLDRPVGWTLSVSVGRPVRFNLGRPPEPGSMYANYAGHKAAPGQAAPGINVVVNSGDALLFRGHAVFHAVDGFADEAGSDSGVVEKNSARGSDGGDSDVGPPGEIIEEEAAASLAPDDWAERLQSAAKARAGDGWAPARLALLFRDEEDARS